MGSMSSLRWTQSCQLLENPLSSGTLSNLSVGTNLTCLTWPLTKFSVFASPQGVVLSYVYNV